MKYIPIPILTLFLLHTYTASCGVPFVITSTRFVRRPFSHYPYRFMHRPVGYYSYMFHTVSLRFLPLHDLCGVPSVITLF